MSQGFARDYIVKATGETEVFVNGVKKSTASGTADISLPLPSGVKNFKVTFSAISTDSTNSIRIRLSANATTVTTGYNASYSYISEVANSAQSFDSLAGFALLRGVATEAHWGAMDFTLHEAASNTWICQAQGHRTDNLTNFTSGEISLASEVDAVVFSPNGGTWDGGEINVTYDNPDLAVSGVESVAAGVTDVFVNGVKQNSTSGTSIDFTVPAGVKDIKVSLVGVSTSGTSPLVLRLGTSGGIKVTGYAGAVSRVTSGSAIEAGTAEFRLVYFGDQNATDVWTTLAHLVLHDAASNTWACHGGSGRSSAAANQSIFTGSASLSGELTTVRVSTSNGTDTFDGGSINIQYDNPELDLGSGVISGGVVQTVNVSDGTLKNNSAVSIPYDDSIPQNTEGAEVLTASITPKNSANKLKIEVHTHWGTDVSAGNGLTTALFQDSTVNALAATSILQHTLDYPVDQTITHWMTAGTASSTTFKVRIGASVSSDANLNAQDGNGVRRMGGVMASGITITEYKV